jgi:hypothetical protein
MTAWIAAGLLVAAFVVLAKLFRLVEKSGDVLAVSQRSLAIVRDGRLSDDAKEVALQQNAKRLFALAFWLALGSTGALLLPFGLVWLCDRLGWLSLASVCDVAISPAFIAVSSVLILVPLIVSARSRRPHESSCSQSSVGPESYTALDRLLHRVAFRSTTAQLALADLEDRMFARQLADCRIDRPVFVTALPRAGTTMLLECCAGLSEFASHGYRDMPFVLVPCLWNRFSTKFRQHAERRERAHGDGVLIDFDSPEALEEVLWKAFWRRHYRPDRIVPWTLDEERDADEFQEFFRSHIRKIALVRRGTDAPAARYLSKNNLNIARLGLLRRLFPDASVVVPFREPLQHAESLLKQHRNFLGIHKDDRFASEYMRAIGHYEFGDNLRPVDFDGWFDRRQSRQADCLAFWLEYWAAGYRHILAEGTGFVRLIDYDALCSDPRHGLELVADAIGCRDPDALLAAADGIHPAKQRAIDTTTVPAAVLAQVDHVYTALKDQADALSTRLATAAA